jgi:LDH2 family malate/lactate/ureidoglycolate dehydrogenase
MASIAPFGGIDPVFTPNPIACGIPTDGDPILIDISTPITTNGMTNRLAASGSRFPRLWAPDHLGNPTDDPMALTGATPGRLSMPVWHRTGQEMT